MKRFNLMKIKGKKVKNLQYGYSDNCIHIIFDDGTEIHVNAECIFDKDGMYVNHGKVPNAPYPTK